MPRVPPRPHVHGPQRTRGGTLLGFFLGLLVGVGAALAVALYVTKVPIPLVDRGVQRKPIQPDTEAERLRGWNPNAGLSNTKPAASAPSDAPTDTPSGPARDNAGAPATDATRDPIAELIRQRTQGDGGSAAAAADPFVYYVQVGAFRSADEAEAQRARLALQGFDAKVSEREQGGQRVWRVRLGPFNTKVDAELMQEKLRGKQFETALVRVQR
ncbi:MULTISPECIES: SPOR domain-containing protein [Tepidimonas]|uniref:Cell division protein FtsN n=1 Tax=Tepidimonas aquatica TaxID=247482 RepID=A0A554WRV3_9BURK|nr:SPOR domain-containing protein [Tepidimonas aquatica]TSE26293.1 Cell division protein FtsN [Tepidimonas aquatica]